MQLSSTLSWLVDEAGETPGADRLVAELGARVVADGLPLAGGVLTLAVPHPLIARRTWLWRADSGEVIEAFGFVAGGIEGAGAGRPRGGAGPPGDAGRRWLAGLAAGLVHEDAVGSRPDGPSLGWIGPLPFTPGEANELRQAARFATAPLAALAARATLTAALEAYLGRRSAARVLAGPLRRDIGETIQAALLCADLRGFTALSESNPPSAVIAALDAWFDRIAAPVHDFGGAGAPRGACGAALRAVSAGRAGMAHLDEARRQQGLPPLPFGAALHLGEMLWGNIGTADRLDFTAIGPAVNLVSRLEGLCRPLGRSVLISGAVAAETNMRLIPLGEHELRGIASPCAVFTTPEN